MARGSQLAASNYIATVEASSARLATAARKGLEPPVPSCPGWTEGILIFHIGAVQRNWALHVQERAQEPIGRLRPEIFEPLPGLGEWARQFFEENADAGTMPPGVIEWFEDGTRELVQVFRETDPEEPIWHWSGDNRALAHFRMQAHEATLHRWDAELAHGRPGPIDAELARDGIDHHFDVMLPSQRGWSEPPPGAGETYHFHRTDGEGEWWVKFDGGDVTVRREHAKGDVAVRGTAENLYLFLWGRAPADRLDVVGDASLLDRYREFVPPAG